MTETIEVFGAVYRCGKAKEITIQEVKNLKKKKRIHYSFKCDEKDEQYISSIFDQFDNSDDRVTYYMSRMCRAKMYWYFAEFYHSYVLYERYYLYILDFIRCCPELLDYYIHYFVMSLIILGKDNEAFTVINVWIHDFQNKSYEDLVPWKYRLLGNLNLRPEHHWKSRVPGKQLPKRIQVLKLNTKSYR